MAAASGLVAKPTVQQLTSSSDISQGKKWICNYDNIECGFLEYEINIRCGHFDICNNLFLPQGLTYLTKKYEKFINFKDETLRAHVLDDKSTAQTKVQIQIVEQLEQQLQKVSKQTSK